MRIQLWNFLYYVKYNLIFAGMYRRKMNTWHAWVRGVPIVLTFICITGWGLVPGVPWLWGILIAMAQLVTLVAEQIPVFLHPPALSYFISEVSSFMVDAENQWDCYSDDDDEKIKNVLHDLRLRFHHIDGLYMEKLDIPDFMELKNAAWDETVSYFDTKYEKSEDHHHDQSQEETSDTSETSETTT
ncbi:MAG TPA: hypothetical protein PLA31_04655 [Clostridia bacterium]|nr:hypothetical protein [Clostridia bacterium]